MKWSLAVLLTALLSAAVLAAEVETDPEGTSWHADLRSWSSDTEAATTATAAKAGTTRKNAGEATVADGDEDGDDDSAASMLQFVEDLLDDTTSARLVMRLQEMLMEEYGDELQELARESANSPSSEPTSSTAASSSGSGSGSSSGSGSGSSSDPDSSDPQETVKQQRGTVDDSFPLAFCVSTVGVKGVGGMYVRNVTYNGAPTFVRQEDDRVYRLLRYNHKSQNRYWYISDIKDVTNLTGASIVPSPRLLNFPSSLVPRPLVFLPLRDGSESAWGPGGQSLKFLRTVGWSPLTC